MKRLDSVFCLVRELYHAQCNSNKQTKKA